MRTDPDGLQKFRPGDIGYIRVKVIKASNDGEGPCAVVNIVDRTGRPVDTADRYIKESTIISKIDMIRAAKEMLQ